MAADHRSDQYAYCVTLYEAVYGHRPFWSDKGHKLALDKEKGGARTG